MDTYSTTASSGCAVKGVSHDSKVRGDTKSLKYVYEKIFETNPDLLEGSKILHANEKKLY